MKHIWSVLCEKSILDDVTKQLSILNVIETLEVVVSKKEIITKDETINVPVIFQVTSLWEDMNIDKSRKQEILLELYSPSDKKMAGHTFYFEMLKGIKRMKCRYTIRGLKIQEAGRYYIRVSWKEKEKKNFKAVVDLPLEVDLKYDIKKIVN